MKHWLIALLLCTPLLASAEPATEATEENNVEGWQAAAPRDPNEPPINWVDTSHAYATNQAQVLTEWMDNFFGDPNYDLEKAESLLRLEWTNAWDEKDNYNTKIRLRGKLQMPRVSKRLNLVFSGEDGDKLGDDRDHDDRVGLLFKMNERKRSRVDLTMGISELRPGIRYRNQGPINEHYSYRFTQRLQWEDSEGFFTTGQLNLDHAVSTSKLARWSNRIRYGEETEGAEWRSVLSLRERRKAPRKKHQLVVSYFGSVNGYTDPSYIRTYRLGMLFRRQFYRPFLFVELEPSYGFRKDDVDDKRDGAWNVVLRFEIALERDLRRVPDKASDKPAR